MFEVIFNQEGDFEALYAAKAWCRSNNISYGSTCRDEPIGLMHGDYYVAKWKNLTAKERRTVDGVILGDKRNGPLTIKMYVPIKP